ncbi:hypothetical protein CEK28_08565 [Xenophilus sp. AP218F]|nr:hypothetical protein CEK28_08565 [Xenophilus sp. AP218F]
MRPIANIRAQSGALQIAAAIEQLSRMRLSVIGATLDSRRAPVIQIRPPGKNWQGRARWSQIDHHTVFGPYRQGQLEICGCLVVWQELK